MRLRTSASTSCSASGDCVGEPRATEGEDPRDEIARTVGGEHDVVDVAAQRGACVGVLQRKFPVAEHRAQDVVEVVRNAAGKGAQGLELL